MTAAAAVDTAGARGPRRRRARAGLEERHQPRLAARRSRRRGVDLRGALVADDTRAFADGLRSLGFEITGDAAGRLRVRGAAGRIPATEASVWCADAGTAARFLLAACAAGHGRFAFDASAQLRRRPMGLLLDALRAQGAAFEPAGADALPVTVVADGLAGGDVSPSRRRVQPVRLGPAARRPTRPLAADVRVERLVSRPYVDMTLAMMAQFGVDTDREDHTSFRVRPSTYRAQTTPSSPTLPRPRTSSPPRRSRRAG